MFTDDISENWDSTETQDIFIQEYFGKGKVLSKSDKKISPADGSKKFHSKTNFKNEYSKDNNLDVACNSNRNRNKRSLNSEFRFNEKKLKPSSGTSSQDACCKMEKNGTDDEMEESHVDVLNCQKSKKKKKSRNKDKNSLKKQSSCKEMPEKIYSENQNTSIIDTLSNNSSTNKNSLFQSKSHQKLQAAKFRYLNEMLYTNAGQEALSYFQENTDEFQDYHVGYQSQVSKWPINPVDIIIQEIRQMDKQRAVADLGCGEAMIAEAFPKRTIYSFDLIALKDCVTACDMANVPLPSNSVDVAVFCLSLMGTNWKDYIKEGRRILKLGAVLKIAEIESRIENLDIFVKNIESYGFSLENKNVSHKMFVFINFKKTNRSRKSSKVPDVTLKPCLYKKR